MLKTLKMALKHTRITLPYILIRNKYFYYIIGHFFVCVNILISEKRTKTDSDSRQHTAGNHNERKKSIRPFPPLIRDRVTVASD